MRPFPFRRLAMYYLGHRVLLDLFSPDNGTEFKLNYLKKLFGPQQHHLSPGSAWKERVSSSNLGFLVLFLAENENAGGSAICIHRVLLPEEAIVTHVVTCQGRDHLVNIRSGRHSLVIVNVHFEPELTLKQLRGRLCVIQPHWPAYLRGAFFFFGAILTYVIWKKDDLMFGTKHSPMATG